VERSVQLLLWVGRLGHQSGAGSGYSQNRQENVAVIRYREHDTCYYHLHRRGQSLFRPPQTTFSVNHSVREYAMEQTHINGLESFWSMLERDYTGTYRHMSSKHLQRYKDGTMIGLLARLNRWSAWCWNRRQAIRISGFD
jgi:hypothetical protein